MDLLIKSYISQSLSHTADKAIIFIVIFHFCTLSAVLRVLSRLYCSVEGFPFDFSNGMCPASKTRGNSPMNFYLSSRLRLK